MEKRRQPISAAAASKLYPLLLLILGTVLLAPTALLRSGRAALPALLLAPVLLVLRPIVALIWVAALIGVAALVRCAALVLPRIVLLGLRASALLSLIGLGSLSSLLLVHFVSLPVIRLPSLRFT
jgi:hypothetical protein